MKRGCKLPFLAVVFTIMTILSASAALAEAEHKMVIQVSSADPLTQKIAVNNAVNLQKMYGIDNVQIELVAYGPGLGLLTAKSPEAARIKSLALQDITFSACGNTISKVEKKSGKTPVLTEGVRVVPAGVGRIMEAQEEGYAYLRP